MKRFSSAARVFFLLGFSSLSLVNASQLSAQTNYVSWNFATSITSANYSSNTTNQNAARSTALTGATLSTISLNGVTAANANTNHRSTGWPTSLDATKYLEFSVTLSATEYFPNSTLNLAIASLVNSTTTAPRNYSVYYGWGASPTFAIVNATSNAASGTATTGGTVTTLTTASTTNNAVVPAPGNTSTQKLTIRILAYGTTSSTGNYQMATVALTGSAPSAGASITGAATTTAFTTTHGTPSATQNFSVSGSGLSANLVATAPSGFELTSNGGTNWGSTASFTQSSGSASGTLGIRIKANAPVTGSFNSQNIVLSSTGATSVNITTPASGNAVSKATPTITVTGSTSFTANGSSQGPDGYTAPAVGGGLTPTGSVTFSYSGTGSTSYGPSATKPSAEGTYSATATIAADDNYNTASSSAYSFQISNQLTQTISFTTITSPVTYGVASFNLTATATSGLTVTFESSNTSVATVSGNTVTIVAPGTTNLIAKQAGDATYAAATDVSQSLTVNAKPLTVAGAVVTTKEYDRSTSATITGASLSGGIVGSDVVALTGGGSFNTATAGNNKAVTTTFSLTGADASKYSLTQPTITGNISQKGLTITGATASNKVFDGTTAATITGTLSGVISPDAVALVGTGTFASSAVGNGIAVTSTSTLSGADAGNYSLTQPTGLTANITSNAFTPGNLVVYRVGSGTGSLVNTGNPVFLDEYTTTGTLVRSLAMPTTTSGSNFGLIANGTSTSEGMLTRSVDNRYLMVTGYASTAATSLSGTAAGTVRRVVGRVDADGLVNTTTGLTDFADANTPRAAASTNGTDLWVAGGAGSVRYATLGSSTSSQLMTTPTNLRTLSIVNGQLYTSQATSLGSVGTGTPTTSGQTLTTVVTGTGTSMYNFFFADLNSSVAGPDVVYTVDDATDLIYKFSLVSGAWTANGSVAALDIRGLTGSVSGTTVTLFGTTGASAAAGGGSIYTKVDNSGYNATITTGAATSIVTASANTAFRGIAFAPVNPVAPVISSSLTAGHTYGAAGSYTIVASNEPTSFGATSLPSGATFSSPTISIPATTTAGAYSIDISASNSAGADNEVLVYTISKATPVVTVTGSTSFTFTGSPQGPNSATAPAVGSGNAPTGTITYSYSGTGSTSYGPSATQPTDAGTYEVVASIASDDNYNSASSAAFAFTISSLLSQTITFDALSAVTYGDAPVTLSATSTSGLTVQFSSSNTNVASISGNTLTIVGPGTANITASQPGDATYAPASNVIRSFTVNVKPLTVTGASVTTKEYDRATTATITGATLSGGIVGSDVVSLSGGGSFTTAAVGTNKPITTTFSLTGADAAKYSLTQPTLTGNITAKSLTISGAAASGKLFDGTTNATITGTLAGVISPDVVTLTATGTFASSAVGNNIAVTSTSTLGGAAASNYTLTQPTGLTASIFAVLAKGDITILGYNTNTPDNFTFVNWVDLQNGAFLKFTDNGFLSSSSSTTTNNARGGENFVIWQNNTGSAIAAGTVIRIEGLTATTGAATAGSASGLNGLASGGDQIFVYQSNDNTGGFPGFAANANPTTFGGGTTAGNMIFGLNMNSAWLTTGTASASTSYLPSDLNVTNGSLNFATNAQTGQYTGSRSNQTSIAAYKTLVNNPANWTTAASGTTTLNTTAFTVQSNYTITASAGSGGSISPSGSVSVAAGGNQSFTITADPCYVIEDVLVNGVSQGDVSSYEFINVNANATISATFVPSTFTTWNGSVNNNWDNPSNWSCGVPNSSLTAFIPGGSSPALASDASVLSLSIQPSAVVDLNGRSLSVASSVLGLGTISGSASSNLTIGFTSTLRFTSGAGTLKNLTIEAGTTTLATALSISGGTATEAAGTVTVASGAVLQSDGNLTLKSNAFGTARVASGSTSGNYITGNVTVERYVPVYNSSLTPSHIKAWRMLSVPTRVNGGRSIRSAWQEEGNSSNGFGTLISGTTSNAVSLGFDNQSSNFASMQYYSGTAWVNVPNTNSYNLDTAGAFFVFIRGNRTVGSTTTVTDNSKDATLRTTGLLYQGNGIPVGLTHAFNSVGNVYASAINFTQLQSNNSTKINEVFYLWDAKRRSGSSLGGYQTFSATNGYGCTPGGGSFTLNQVNTTIQSGQGFFVSPKSPGTGQRLLFDENVKISGSSNNAFRPVIPADQLVKIDTRLLDAANQEVADGNTVVFSERYANAVDADDAKKLKNSAENFGIANGTDLLAVEGRQPVADGNELVFAMSNLKEKNYLIEVRAQQLSEPGLDAQLEDSYTSVRTPLNLGGTTVVPVTVNADAGSKDANRFRIVFSRKPVAGSISSFTVSPNPVQGGRINLQLNNQAAGRYQVRLLNAEGKVMLLNVIEHPGGSSTRTLMLSAKISAGIYTMELIGPDAGRQNLQVLVTE